MTWRVARIAEELQAPAATAWHNRPGPCPSRGSRSAPGARPGRRRPGRAGTGTGRRTWCGEWRGARSSWRTSATSATTGRGRSGRSSSRRRGSLAKPSSLRIAATAAGLSDSPSRAKARLMSWTERFCLRRATTCCRSRFCLPGGRPWRAGGDEEIAVGLVAELVDEDAETSRRVAEASGRLGRWEAVDEEGPEGLVLSMGGVGGLQEAAGQR